jgi:tetratricopeptide (TPR) repeat protein
LATARFGNWLETERVCQAALRANPNASGVIFQYGRTLLEVGRLREAIPKFEHSFALGRRMARSQGLYGETLWCVGQTERALEVLNEANTQWPRHTAIWFPLLFIHAYRGDVRATSAMIDNVATRPVGVPQEEFDAWRLVARAASSKGKGDIERAFDVHRRFATRGVGLAGNTVGVLATFGALDQAFALAEAVYGLSDKKLPERAYSETQLGFLTMEQRMTRYLFRPDTAPLHADRRFARLCANIGLEAYWAETKTQPDFRVAQRG